VVSAFGGVFALLGVLKRSVSRASSSTLDLKAFKGVYLANRWALGWAGGLDGALRAPSLSTLLSVTLSSVSTLFLKSFSSSMRIYLAALCLNSAILAVGLLHRLSAKGPLRNPLIIWWRATSGLKLSMLRVVFPKRSTNALSDVHMYVLIRVCYAIIPIDDQGFPSNRQGCLNYPIDKRVPVRIFLHCGGISCSHSLGVLRTFFDSFGAYWLGCSLSFVGARLLSFAFIVAF